MSEHQLVWGGRTADWSMNEPVGGGGACEEKRSLKTFFYICAESVLVTRTCLNEKWRKSRFLAFVCEDLLGFRHGTDAVDLREAAAELLVLVVCQKPGDEWTNRSTIVSDITTRRVLSGAAVMGTGRGRRAPDDVRGAWWRGRRGWQRRWRRWRRGGLRESL